MFNHCKILDNFNSSKGNCVLGIDASNIRGGGGLTHLYELITNIAPVNYGISKVLIWAPSDTIDKLPKYDWLYYRSPSAININSIFTYIWQRFFLSKCLKVEGCALLFVLGGTYLGNFRPYVVLNQNLLPFEFRELFRFGFSTVTFRLLLLRYLQSKTIKNSNGVIFLSEYARRAVSDVVYSMPRRTSVIPHGVSDQFQSYPKRQYAISSYCQSNPFSILYVSVVDEYKHQCEVVKAVNLLIQDGYPVKLTLVGPSYPPSLKRLYNLIAKCENSSAWCSYIGPLTYKDMISVYSNADMAVFASSCESFGMILLESMASGLPVAASNMSAIPEVLGNSGIYFNPENFLDIHRNIRFALDSLNLRSRISHSAYKRAQTFSWQKSADQTFNFLKLFCSL